MTATSIVAKNSLIPEPPRGSDVPNDVTWDPYNGQYISEDVEVDPSTGDLNLKDKRAASTDLVPENAVDPMEQWLKNHQNSVNELDKALLKYDEESKKQLPYKSYYSSKDDKALPILTTLGEAYVPEMITRIEQGDVWSGTLMAAVQEITKIYGTPIDVSPEGKNKWIQNFKQKSNGKY